MNIRENFIEITEVGDKERKFIATYPGSAFGTCSESMIVTESELLSMENIQQNGKVMCLYCRSTRDQKLDNCPHCGAPNG